MAKKQRHGPYYTYAQAEAAAEQLRADGARVSIKRDRHWWVFVKHEEGSE